MLNDRDKMFSDGGCDEPSQEDIADEAVELLYSQIERGKVENIEFNIHYNKELYAYDYITDPTTKKYVLEWGV